MDLGGQTAFESAPGVAQASGGGLQAERTTVNGPTSSRLDAALTNAHRGWPVFPLHSVRDGRCSCGHAACASIGKHPRTENGLKDATTDEAVIRRWWAQAPDADVGIVTEWKSGLLVLDVDRPDGISEAVKEAVPKTGSGLAGTELDQDAGQDPPLEDHDGTKTPY